MTDYSSIDFVIKFQQQYSQWYGYYSIVFCHYVSLAVFSETRYDYYWEINLLPLRFAWNTIRGKIWLLLKNSLLPLRFHIWFLFNNISPFHFAWCTVRVISEIRHGYYYFCHYVSIVILIDTRYGYYSTILSEKHLQVPTFQSVCSLAPLVEKQETSVKIEVPIRSKNQWN